LTGWIWGSAAALYLLFRLFYDNQRGPLTQAEVDHYMTQAEQAGADAVNDPAIVRAFLEADDGREFVMVNLVRVGPGEVAHPETGAPTTGQAMMQRYAKTFMPGLMKRGGHPAIVTRKIAGYVDAWHVPPDPGWNIVGFMRYRSRRDMIQMATDPRFKNIHKFKIAGTAETFSFPTQTVLRAFIGPRIWVGLVLALIAALLQIALAPRA
jgi:hypothetical protein